MLSRTACNGEDGQKPSHTATDEDGEPNPDANSAYTDGNAHAPGNCTTNRHTNARGNIDRSPARQRSTDVDADPYSRARNPDPDVHGDLDP